MKETDNNYHQSLIETDSNLRNSIISENNLYALRMMHINETISDERHLRCEETNKRINDQYDELIEMMEGMHKQLDDLTVRTDNLHNSYIEQTKVINEIDQRVTELENSRIDIQKMIDEMNARLEIVKKRYDS